MSNNITIGITGPESSGKTYLSEYLHSKYKSILIKEYAREYLKKNSNYSFQDVVNIGNEQFNRIKKAQKEHSNTLIILDTEMTVIKIWLMDKFGKIPDELMYKINNQDINYYILCKPDLEWESDPLREDRNRREYLYNLYKKELKNKKNNLRVVKGHYTERKQIADDFIRSFY